MSNFKKYREQLKEGSRPTEPSTVQAENASAYNPGITNSSVVNPEDGTNFLKSFLNATPFFDLFEYVAERHYSGKSSVVKVTKLKTLHPGYFGFCVWADVVVRMIVVAALITIAIYAASKIVS